MINLAVEEQTELRDFSVIRKEVADSHKTIHTKLIELQGALVQLKSKLLLMNLTFRLSKSI